MTRSHRLIDASAVNRSPYNRPPVELAHVRAKWTPVCRQGHAQPVNLENISIPQERDML
jgi:hypothetical protein